MLHSTVFNRHGRREIERKECASRQELGRGGTFKTCQTVRDNNRLKEKSKSSDFGFRPIRGCGEGGGGVLVMDFLFRNLASPNTGFLESPRVALLTPPSGIQSNLFSKQIRVCHVSVHVRYEHRKMASLNCDLYVRTARDSTKHVRC